MHSSKRHHYRAERLHAATPLRVSYSPRTPNRQEVSRTVVKRQRPSKKSVAKRYSGSGSEHSFNPKELRSSALAEARAGNYVDAIALFNQILQQNPLSATDYNNRGLVYFRNQQHSEALDDYNMAIALNADLDSVYNNRANYHAHQGNWLEAILDYDRAIELNPFNVRAWINQGITFRDMELYDRALECFDAALNFAQFEDHIYVERGRTYHLRGDWNCAIADYQRAKECFYVTGEPLNQRSLRLLSQVEEWLDDLLMPLDPMFGQF